MADVLINFIANDQTSGVLGGIGGAFGNFGNIVTGIKSALDLMGQAFDAAVGFATPFIESAMDSENAIANLEATLKSTGGAVGLTSQQLQDMANSFQSVTKFSDETIINGEAMLLTFTNIGKDVFPMATEAMLNLAEKFGSVDSASVQLGKALNDPINGITALQRVGVSFSDEQKEMIKTMVEAGDTAGAQKVILAELEKEFGGLAVAMGDTFQGQWEIFKNSLDNIREIIGGALLPVLGDLLTKFNEFVNSPQVIQFFKDLGAAIADMATGDFSGIDALFGNLFQSMADAVNNWVTGGGPEQLTEDIIGWIDDIANSNGFDSRALTAAGNLVNAIIRALGQVDWSGIAETMDNAIAGIISQHDWKSAGDQFGKDLVDALQSGISTNTKSSSSIAAIGKALSDWFLAAAGVANWTEFKNTFQGIINQFVLQPIADWVSKNWYKIFLPMLPTQDQFKEGYAAWHELAINIMQGLQDGMSDALSSLGLDWWVTWWTEHIITPVKNLLGIASPSKLFSGIGGDIVRGFIEGITSMADWATDLIKSWLADVLAPFKAVLDFLGIDTSGIFGSSGGSTGSHDTGGVTTPGDGSTGTATTVTNNYYFYGTTYVNQAGPEGTYECVPSPIITDTSTLNPGGGTIGTHPV